MLSRASLHSLQRPLCMLLARNSSTTPATSASATPTVAAAQTGTATEPLYQRRVRAEQSDPVRYGFVPEEWFTFFYKKTGVTGPYAFGFGLFTYLASKEIYVMEHEFYSGLSFALLLIIIVKKIGPGVKQYLDAEIKEQEQEWKQGREDNIKKHEDGIEHEKKEQWRADGQLLLNDAQKENVSLQLEAAYRQRLAKIYSEVKRRLDYQVEVQHVERRIKQKHLVNWVTSKVLASITPDQDKETLNKCLADLTALATAKAK